MRRTVTRLACTAAVTLSAVAFAVPLAGPASALKSGDFTRITTPSKDTSLNVVEGKTALTVAGVASTDIPTVDIVCIDSQVNFGIQSSTFASKVPVKKGSFSVTFTLPASPTPACRLTAVPSSADASSSYLASYTGPILRSQQLEVDKVGNIADAFAAYVEDGDGVALFGDAGNCTQQGGLTTEQTPELRVGAVQTACFFSLPGTEPENSATATRSAVVVDGRSAYLPSAVHSYLDQSRGLSVGQSPLTVSRSIAANGDTTVAEVATLERCSAANTYPPTAKSCPKVVSTGVQFRRTTLVFRDGHQMRLRDQFVSIDHHGHSVSLQYLNAAATQAPSDDTAQTGFLFPHHSGGFTAGHAGAVVTGLGAGPGTVYLRSDLHARSDDIQADTLGETWSREPSRLAFSAATPSLFRLSYTLTLAAGGTGFLGFAVSERAGTSDVTKLAALAVADMRPGLSITTPANGATYRTTTTTVRGALSAGANGLPTSVTVSGHRATVKASSATKATYSVVFGEKAGTHTLTVTATDAGGVTVSKSVRVRNA